jgi:hypothetical protein
MSSKFFTGDVVKSGNQEGKVLNLEYLDSEKTFRYEVKFKGGETALVLEDKMKMVIPHYSYRISEWDGG